MQEATLDMAALLAGTNNIEPRPYQTRIVGKVYQNLSPIDAGGKGLRSVLIQSPTGSGKTILSLLSIKALQARYAASGRRLEVGWIAMRRNLLTQAEAENTKKGVNADIHWISMFQKELPGALLAATHKMLVIDEAQHDAASSCMHIHAQLEPELILGMSVGGDSMVLVRHPDGTIHHTRIDHFIDEVIGASDDRITYVDGYQVRAFHGTGFVWKGLKSVIKHRPTDKKTYRVKTQKGRSLLITEDHSVYRVVAGGTTRTRDDGSSITGHAQPVAAIEEITGSALSVGDWLLLEDTVGQPASPVVEVDMTATVAGNGWRVAGDFADWIEANITEDNGYAGANKVRYDRRHGSHGPYLSPDEYASLPDGSRRGLVYFAGNGNTCRSHLCVSDLAYLIGFYLGNGWTDASQIVFSANDCQLPTLRAALVALSASAEFTVSERPMDGSTEVSICNKVLTDWFKANVGGRAWQKRAPSICYSMAHDDVRAVLAGMLDTDGSQLFSAQNRRTWHYTTTSSGLAADLCELLKRVMVTAGVSRRSHNSGGVIDGRQIVGRRRTYTVHFSGHAYDGNNSGVCGGRHHFVMGELRGTPVQVLSIEEEPVDYVYDFSVDDHQWQSFVASGFAVHNSATPFRSDRVKICFDSVIADAGIANLIKDGYLSQYDHYTIPTWTPTAVSSFYLREPERFGKSIMYFHTVEACHETRKLLELGGVSCAVVTGDSDKETQIKAFRDGTYDVLINCFVLAEGFDCCELQTVFCRPSCKGVSIQMGGRVFRICPALRAKGIRKIIVQPRLTRWPFIKTATPNIQYLWTPTNGNMDGKDVSPEQAELMCLDGEWRSLTVNPQINQINRRMLVALAGINVEMPKYLLDKQKKKKPRYGQQDG